MFTKQIFIVETSLPLRRLLANALSQEDDFSVVSITERLADALNLTGVPSPQVVVLDDGATGGPLDDNVGQIAERFPAARIVVLTSGYQDVIRRDLGNIGIWAVLRKPFTLEALFAAIRTQSASCQTTVWCL